MLYAENSDALKSNWKDYIDGGSEIELHLNTEYLDYIDKIKSNTKYIGQYHKKNGYEIRECYSTTCFCGKVLIQLTLDTRDNTYLDCVHYQVWEWEYVLVPISWTVGTPKDFYNNIINVDRMKYVEYSFRSHGDPKLTRPKELKGIKSIGSAEFITKKCNTQVFVEGNNVWIKHTDYFSSIWRPPASERFDMPLSYYLRKYFGKNKSEKFIYPDGWGEIVLRNEAWIRLDNLVPMCRYKEMNHAQIAREILRQQKFVISGMTNEVCLEWERYWERVVKLVRENA